MFGRLTRPAAVLLTVGLVFALGAGTTSAQAAGQRPSPAPYNLYFGDLHAHTSYSDGARGSTPDDAFSWATEKGADFMATTDHQGSLTSAEWADTLAAAQRHTSATFVAMAGYEAWVVGIGEINMFNTPNWPKEPTGKGADKANSGHHGNRWLSLPETYDWLAAQPGAVGQWNHPTAYAGVSSENFVGFADRTASRDEGMGLIEVFNDVVYESSYVLALDSGWHVMPAANSDTHDAGLDLGFRGADGAARPRPERGRPLRGHERGPGLRDARQEPAGAVHRERRGDGVGTGGVRHDLRRLGAGRGSGSGRGRCHHEGGDRLRRGRGRRDPAGKREQGEWTTTLTSRRRTTSTRASRPRRGPTASPDRRRGPHRSGPAAEARTARPRGPTTGDQEPAGIAIRA